MMDPTREEQFMKRAATILGIAAALAVPATASAGNSLQLKPQLKPQLKAQIITTQIATVQVARTQRVSAARYTAQRATSYRIKLKHKAAR
jgi:hypothetical protein